MWYVRLGARASILFGEFCAHLFLTDRCQWEQYLRVHPKMFVFSVAITILTWNLTGLVLEAFTMERLFAKF